MFCLQWEWKTNQFHEMKRQHWLRKQTLSFNQTKPIHKSINQTFLIELMEVNWFVLFDEREFVFAEPRSALALSLLHFIKTISISFQLFFFHSATGRQTKSKTFGLWPGARSPSAFTIQSICPFGRADWNELLNCWMGRASHQSVHLPQIQIKLTHRFVFVYNSWLAAYTVIVFIFGIVKANFILWSEREVNKIKINLWQQWRNVWMNFINFNNWLKERKTI